MITVRTEIEKLMQDLSFTEGVITAGFVFPEEFIGFQGHFPSKKVLPGVCQIQCVVCMLEKALISDIGIREIIHAKFHVPVLPSQEISCECRKSKHAGDEMLISAVLRRGDTMISEFKLRVTASFKEA